MPSKDKTVNFAKPSMLALSLSLTTFWVLNIFKEAFAPVKNTLNFYKPVGPLLGLFVVSILVFGIGTYLFSSQQVDKKLSDKKAFVLYVVATLLFFLMVFPPFFEPIVEVLAGK